MMGVTPQADHNASLTAAVARAPIIVTIDGPAGSGKSTLAAELAARIHAVPLHTGRHYRAVALALTRAGLGIPDEFSLAAWLRHASPSLLDDGRLVLHGQSYTPFDLESAEADRLVSPVSNQQLVRRCLISLQRAWVDALTRTGRGVVVEGRDAATQIAPQAHHRIYLDCSPTERAERRLRQRGENAADFFSIRADIEARDAEDQGLGRTTRQTPGVTVIATDGLDRGTVLTRLLRMVLDETLPPAPATDIG